MRFEKYLGRRSMGLYGLSLLYRFAIWCRHVLYDRGCLRTYRSSCLVVSVGNVAVGGTGKTPFVAKLVKELSRHPGDIAVIARGYKAAAERSNLQVSAGQGPVVSSREAGDEPFWLALQTQASVWVGKNRVKSIQEAVSAGSKICVLEDGLQHRRVKRDVEIVLLDGLDPFGGGYFLPRGLLRDSSKRLAGADWIVVTHLEGDSVPDDVLCKIRKVSPAPVIGMRSVYKIAGIPAGSTVGAFCGIAKPELFYAALRSMGMQVLEVLSVGDHERVREDLLESFARKCLEKGISYLICTEKDLVKLQKFTYASLPVIALKMELECIGKENLWQEMCRSIQDKEENFSRNFV